MVRKLFCAKSTREQNQCSALVAALIYMSLRDVSECECLPQNAEVRSVIVSGASA